ncbi:MAG: tetratricopeptide repeat protein, partial [Bacteroidota bacterium]
MWRGNLYIWAGDKYKANFIIVMREGIFLIAIILLYACSGPVSQESLQSQIAGLELKIDSLEKNSNRGENMLPLNEHRLKLAQAYEQYADENKGKDSIQSEEYLALAASLYQNTLQQIDKALSLNDRIIAEYPESERAVFALFNKGDIYNNYRRDTSMARTIYSEIISKYPH